jgi:hypothetical protein
MYKFKNILNLNKLLMNFKELNITYISSIFIMQLIKYDTNKLNKIIKYNNYITYLYKYILTVS